MTNSPPALGCEFVMFLRFFSIDNVRGLFPLPERGQYTQAQTCAADHEQACDGSLRL